MKSTWKRTRLIGLSLLGLGGIIAPSTLCLVGCSQPNPDEQSTPDNHDQLPNTPPPPVSTVPLTQLQAQANQITTINQALTFINQTLAQYYRFEMFQADLQHSLTYQYQIANLDYQYEEVNEVESIQPSSNPHAINLSFHNFSFATNQGIQTTIKDYCVGYQIPYLPILVNVNGVIYLAMTVGLNHQVFQGSEPQGNVTKFKETMVCDWQNDLSNGEVSHYPPGLSGTNERWILGSCQNFKQNVVYEYRPRLGRFDDVYRYWEAHWASGDEQIQLNWFMSKYFPISFPKLKSWNHQYPNS